jgi:hypothetical protein
MENSNNGDVIIHVEKCSTTVVIVRVHRMPARNTKYVLDVRYHTIAQENVRRIIGILIRINAE